MEVAGRQQAGRQQAGRQQAGRQQAGRQQAGRQQAGRQQAGRQQAGQLAEVRRRRQERLVPLLRSTYFPGAPGHARLVAEKPLFGGWENQVLLLRLTSSAAALGPSPTPSEAKAASVASSSSSTTPQSEGDVRCVFRLHDTDPALQTLQSVRDELQLLDTMRGAGIPVPVPVPVPAVSALQDPSRRQGEDSGSETLAIQDGRILVLDGQRCGVMFEFCHGKHFIASRERWQTQEAGMMIGRIHKVTQNYQDFRAPRLRLSVPRIVKRMNKRLPAFEALSDEARRIGVHLRRFKAILEEGEERFVRGTKGKLPFGVVHGDLHDRNVLWVRRRHGADSPLGHGGPQESDDVESGWEIGLVLDWDTSMLEPLVVDLGLSIVEWCTELETKRLDLNLWRLFQRNYEAGRGVPLSEAEKEALWYYAFLASLMHLSLMADVRMVDEEGWEWLDIACSCLSQLADLGQEGFQQVLEGQVISKDQQCSCTSN